MSVLSAIRPAAMFGYVSDTKTDAKASHRLLDFWRGLAALWVVMDHACSARIGQGHPEMLNIPLYAFSHAALGVLMFFVISGYCITAAVQSTVRKGGSAGDFMWARAIRIYPPYLVATLVAASITILAQWLASCHRIPPVEHLIAVTGRSFEFYFASLTLTQLPLHQDCILMSFWSLCYQIAFYAIVTVVLAVLRKGKIEEVFTGINCITIIAFTLQIMNPGKYSFPLDLWFPFGLGSIAYQIVFNRSNIFGNLRGAAVGMGLILSITARGVQMADKLPLSIQVLACIAFCAVLVLTDRYGAGLLKFRPVLSFAALGSISYSVYLTHPIMRPILMHIGDKLHFTGNLYWVSYWMQVVVEIAIGYLFYRFAEQPLAKLAKLSPIRIPNLLPKLQTMPQRLPQFVQTRLRPEMVQVFLSALLFK